MSQRLRGRCNPVVASCCARANLTGVSDFGTELYRPGGYLSGASFGGYDDFADGPESDGRTFQMRPREGNADDGDCEHNREQEVNDRQR